MINYKTLRFQDNAIEQNFNNWYLSVELNIFRYALLLGIVANCLFIPLDYFLHEGMTTTRFLILRLVASFMVLAVYRLTFTQIKRYKQYQFFTLSFALFCFSIPVVASFFENVDSFYFYTSNAILTIFVFILLNIRFYLLRYIAVLLFITHSVIVCLLYTSPSPRDATLSRMPSSA